MVVDEAIQEEVIVQMNFFQKFIEEIKDDFIVLSIKVLMALIVLIIGILIIRIIRKAIKKGLEKAEQKTSLTNVRFVDQTIKFVLYAILFVIIAQFFGVSAASVIALLGSAGLTMGLAFQGALSNFAGGVLLLIHRPFSIGDFITVGDDKSEGEVVEIGMIYTVLKFNPRKIVVVPNGKLANATVVNHTVDGTRLLQLTFDISYGADIKMAKDVVMDVAKKDEKIVKDENLLVYVDDLADSSVKIGFRAIVPQSDFATTKWRFQEEVKIALDNAGIEIPFNQVDVHIVN